MTSLACLAALSGSTGVPLRTAWPQDLAVRPFVARRDALWQEVVAHGPRFRLGRPLSGYAAELRALLGSTRGTERRMLAAESAMAWVSANAVYDVRPTRDEEDLGGGRFGRLLRQPTPSGHCGDLAGLATALALEVEPSLRAEVVVGLYRPVWDSLPPTAHAWSRFRVAPGVWGRRRPDLWRSHPAVGPSAPPGQGDLRDTRHQHGSGPVLSQPLGLKGRPAQAGSLGRMGDERLESGRAGVWFVGSRGPAPSP